LTGPVEGWNGPDTVCRLTYRKDAAAAVNNAKHVHISRISTFALHAYVAKEKHRPFEVVLTHFVKVRRWQPKKTSRVTLRLGGIITVEYEAPFPARVLRC
jgi:hypothetical protein